MFGNEVEHESVVDVHGRVCVKGGVHPYEGPANVTNQEWGVTLILVHCASVTTKERVRGGIMDKNTKEERVRG